MSLAQHNFAVHSCVFLPIVLKILGDVEELALRGEEDLASEGGKCQDNEKRDRQIQDCPEVCFGQQQGRKSPTP